MKEYTLTQILLTDSHFKAQPQLFTPEPEIFQNIKITHSNQSGLLAVAVEIFLNTTNKSLDAYTKMIGLFQPADWQDPDLERFAKINAPAIIFPFLREHIAALTQKAGLCVLLSPINFVKLAAEQP